MRPQYSKKEGGFTLIEALVSLVILSLALIPALALSQSSVSLEASIRNNLIASELAQEGIEIVKNIRDNNWLNTLTYDHGLVDGTYYVQWDTPSQSGGLPDNRLPAGPLYYFPTLGIYDQDHIGAGWVATIFTRTVTLAHLTSGVGIKIDSNVSWTERTGAKNIDIQSIITDWR